MNFTIPTVMAQPLISSLDRLKRMRTRGRMRPVVFARRGLGLHAMVTSAGIERRSTADYDWHGLRRGPAEFVLLQYTFSGAGALTFEGREMTVGQGQMMLLHFPHDHRYRFDRRVADHWRFFWICLNGEQVTAAWRQAVHRGGPVWTVSESDRLVRNAAHVCEQVIDERIDSPWRASELAYGLAMAVAEHGERVAADAGDDAKMRKAAALVRGRLGERIGVAEMAEAAGYSRYHFTRLFERWAGISPGQYLLRQRLRRVVRMLQTTDQPLKVIARQCGFADANYLCKAFARQYGASPGAVRRSGMYGIGTTDRR